MLRTFLILSVLISLFGSACWGQAPAPETRAIWVSRFEWPSANQATAKANIDRIMSDIAAHHFNTVLFQVRGQCDVYYPSPYEPWTSTFGWSDPGWDPLAYAIQAAHSRGLEFHAYINTHTLASPIPPAQTTPQHMYNLHGPNVAPEQSWMIRTSPTASAGAVDSYYWISPGIPEASWWTRQAVLHVVKNYDVDGVHFDRIRCPASTYSHDPISEARFAGDANPDHLAWADFMRSQITRDLRNIYGEVQLYKPWVKVSAAPFGIVDVLPTTHYQGTGTQSYDQWFQDSWGWMNAHVVDFMVPQIYWETSAFGSAHPFDYLLQDWMEHTGGRFVVAGSTTGDGSKIVSHLVAEQAETRTKGAAGHCIFSYGSMDTVPSGSTTDYWTGFDSVYDQNTTVPEMPWKTRPTTGYIVGRVRDGLGNPVLDAKINLDGDSHNYLSAYDGFFSILDVPTSSNLHLSAGKSGVGTFSKRDISVSAGQVTQVDIVLSDRQGSIRLDKAIYRDGDSVRITVADADLQSQSSLDVRIDSGSEPQGELVTLQATAPGSFSGTIALGTGSAVSGDGVLQAANGDTITAHYHDEDDGSGSARENVATATMDSLAPLISGVLIDEINGSSARVRIATDEPTTAVVYVGTSCGTATRSLPSAATATLHNIVVNGLDPQTTYYVRVEVADAAGHSTTDDNAGQCYSFTTAGYPGLPFYDGFETGTLCEPWISTGTNQYRTLVTSANSPHTGSYHLTMDSKLDGNYSRNQATIILNPAGKDEVQLSFWAKGFSDESNPAPASPFGDDTDFDGVAISTDGVNWYEVQSLATLPATYTKYTVDLDEAMARFGLSYNSAFRIRFSHYDDYGIATDGMAIDDVAVSGRQADDLKVTPVSDLLGKGPVGGPFDFSCTTFTLQNAGSHVVDWLAANPVGWLSVSPDSGTLAPGASVEVVACLTPEAAPLDFGDFTAPITFSNLTSGAFRTRNVTLSTTQLDYFTELFTSSKHNDMSYQTLTFKPNGLPSFYSVCREPTGVFAVDPEGGTTVTLADNASSRVALLNGARLWLYGKSYEAFYIGSNGYITFGSGDTNRTESLANHFRMPRISANYDDINPAAGGSITYKQLADRVAVTFLGVPKRSSTSTNTFQIEMFFDGTIRLTYMGLAGTDGLAGLSAGLGVPSGFSESDFSSYPACGAPAGPAQLQAQALSPREILLHWTDTSDNETSFVLERKAGDGEFVPVAELHQNITSYKDQGLDSKTVYTYRLRALNAWANSEPSNEAQAATLPDLPTAPSNLSVQVLSQTQTQLSWADNSQNETSFTVERKGGDAQEFVAVAELAAGATSFGDSGLSADTLYSYRVFASNADGNSSATEEVEVRTLPNAPAVPGPLSLEAKSAHEIQLVWADNSGNETTFTLERQDAQGGFSLIALLGPDTTTYLDQGLEPDTVYTYRVCASNSGGTSSYSALASLATLPLPPAAPTGLAAVLVGETELSLAWADQSSNETGFILERQVAPGQFVQIATLAANTTSYTDQGLAPGASYTYRVFAYNSGGRSDSSGELSVSTLKPLPAAPSDLSAGVVSQSQIDLAWSDNSSDETDFEIQRSEEGGPFESLALLPANTHSYSDTGLRANTLYSYRVYAVNSRGAQPVFTQASARTLPYPPAIPTDLVASTLSQTQIQLAWSDNSHNETTFTLERSENGQGYAVIAQLGPDTHSYLDSGLTTDTFYSYRVQASNEGGASSYSNESSARTLPNLPEAPGSVVATALSSAEILLSWSQASGATTVSIERKTQEGEYGEIATADAVTTGMSDTGLQASTTYFYRLRAQNAAGLSAYSEETSATTPSGIAPGTLLHTLKAPTAGRSDWFGWSVAGNSKLVVVGAPGTAAGKAVRTGKVYLFDAQTAALVKALSNPTPQAEDQFGWCVAADEQYVVVGAPFDNTGYNDSGCVYVYDTAGALVRTINNPTPGTKDCFGKSLALCAGMLIVGAPGEDAGTVRDAGSVYVFDLASGQLVRTITNPARGSGDQFGWSVAAAQDKLVVGAPYAKNSNSSDAGRVWIVSLATGEVLSSFKGMDGRDHLGFSVACGASGVAVAGAPQGEADQMAQPLALAARRAQRTPVDYGAAFVFADKTAALANPAPAARDNFGFSVAAVGPAVAVGAPRKDLGSRDTGACYVFGADGQMLLSLNNPDPRNKSQFGWSVRAAGTNLVVGAPWDDSSARSAGVVYVYAGY